MMARQASIIIYLPVAVDSDMRFGCSMGGDDGMLLRLGMGGGGIAVNTQPFNVHYTCGVRYISGRMPDSQTREPGFDSPFATISKIGIFILSTMPQFIFSCINEYLVQTVVEMSVNSLHAKLLHD